MLSDEPNPIAETIRHLAEQLEERTLWLECHCHALEQGLLALAKETSTDPKKVLEVVKRAQNQLYSERLIELGQRMGQGLAGGLDRRPEHGEDLLPDGKLWQTPPPSTFGEPPPPSPA